ncbi:DUF2510 domain-containing protein [Homoserinimonas aerilata]|uniref:DUF2510 domain-containing protein n=1 Tax=Homoserinimonas aerilata TaxID=1162970 RepID=UPI002482B9C1|nr:DUF2510 domain-containing protein [Homoserinimonas aerilata]
MPAGWYPDPMGLPQLRWWDNHSWTEFTSAARTPLIMQDQPPLAYADDDLPSRRSQREQRDREEQYVRLATEGAAEQPPMSKAELISTLRQLEPPKPQHIERNQPSPFGSQDEQDRMAREQAQAAQQAAAQEHFAREQAAQQQREAQFRAQQQAAAQARAAQQAAEEQARAAQQGFGAAPEADPFAEFISPSAPQEPRPARSSVNYSDGPSFPQAPASEPGFAAAGQSGYGGNPSAQYVPQDAEYGRRTEYARPQRRITDPSQQIYTPAAWAIAIIPLVQMVIILLGVSSGAAAIPVWVPALIMGLPYVASIVLAYFDHKALLQAGHRAPAHWAWAFLTPLVYLIVRSVATNREFGKGMTPVLIWASLAILQVLSIVAVPGILIAAVPDVFKAEVEQSITDDAAIVGTALDVTCPNPAVQIGVQFTCLGVTQTGNQVEINVSLQRANGWIDWRVDSQVWQSGALTK